MNWRMLVFSSDGSFASENRSPLKAAKRINNEFEASLMTDWPTTKEKIHRTVWVVFIREDHRILLVTPDRVLFDTYVKIETRTEDGIKSAIYKALSA